MTAEILQRIEEERLVGMHRLADWWLALFPDPGIHDHNDPAETADRFVGRVGLSSMALQRKPCPPITDELRAAFRAGFVRRAQPADDSLWDHHIGTDYGPCRVLGETMDECGIPRIRAPWKTGSHAYGGGLVVRVTIGHYLDVDEVIYVAPIVETLAAMSDAEIAQIPDPHRRLQLRWMVKMGAQVFLERALATRSADPDRMAYVLDAIRRGRAAIEASR